MQNEEIQNLKITQVDRNIVRIFPYFQIPLLYQIQPNATQVSVRYMSSVQKMLMGPQTRHLLFLHPWANRVAAAAMPIHLQNVNVWLNNPRGRILRHPATNNTSMKIIDWNIRGAGGRTKQMALHEMISDYRPFMVIVMDTRMSFANSMRIIGTFGYANHYIIPCAHDTPQLGSFWFLWDVTQTSVILHEAGDRITYFRIVPPPADHVIANLFFFFLKAMKKTGSRRSYKLAESVGMNTH